MLITHGCSDTLPFVDMLKRVQPKVHLMGHFHDLLGAWVNRHAGNVLSVNAASCDPLYRCVQGAVVVDIPTSS